MGYYYLYFIINQINIISNQFDIIISKMNIILINKCERMSPQATSPRVAGCLPACCPPSLPGGASKRARWGRRAPPRVSETIHLNHFENNSFFESFSSLKSICNCFLTNVKRYPSISFHICQKIIT